MKLYGFMCFFMKLRFQEMQQPCGFTDFYKDTWNYENRSIYYDSQFHGVVQSFLCGAVPACRPAPYVGSIIEETRKKHKGKPHPDWDAKRHRHFPQKEGFPAYQGNYSFVRQAEFP